MRKWTTTNFDSGKVIAAGGAGASASALNHRQGAENGDAVIPTATRGRRDDRVAEARIPEED